MFGKLIKYEWKGAARVCMPLYGLLLITALMTRISMNFTPTGQGGLLQNLGILSQVISSMLYGGLITASFIITAVILIQRFFKNLLGDEGYLMFTLPVSIGKHILSKTIVALMMCILCCIVTILSAFLLAFEPYMFARLAEDLNMLMQQVGGESLLCFLSLCIASLVCLANYILRVYFCIAVGHMARRHRMLGAAGTYVGISILLTTLLVCFGNTIGSSVGHAINAFFESLQPPMAFTLLMLGIALVYGIACTIYFFATRYILSNRLNLE